MADESVPVAETPKKASKSSSKTKKMKAAAAHPKISVMVAAAITDLKERGGSSLQAIKKYIASNYKVDIERLSPFIKKYLKTAVTTGELIQTKGKGASGSFKLKVSAAKGEVSVKAVKTTKKQKPAAATAAARKTAKTVRKAPAKKVTKKPKAEKKSKPAKSPKKPKAKAAAKPKSKPKKAKASPKKAAGKKKK